MEGGIDKRMNFPMPISEWKICDCGKGDWEIKNITVDNKIKERFKTLLSPKEQRHLLVYMKKRGETLPERQYILKMCCKGCGFSWNKFVSEKIFKQGEFNEFKQKMG